MIKNWKKFNEDISSDGEIIPIGIDNMVEGTNGLVRIFSPLEEDMVDNWNEDEQIRQWVEEKRVFLQQVKYDAWSIWVEEGDEEVKGYIIKNYSW
jgi:hypothetical protein